MAEVETFFKAPAVKRAKGRARPDEPLAAMCVVCGERPATCRHHRLRRSRGGSDDPTNTLDACDECHLMIHENPALSYRRGWLIRGAS